MWCSTDPFNELKRHAQSKNPEKRKLNLTLEAIVEVIKERRAIVQRSEDEVISNTEYFAALMTALDSQDGSHATEVLILLSLVLPVVSESVLRSKYALVSNSLEQIIKTEGIEGPLLKASLVCLGSLLKSQEATYDVWSRPAILKMFHLLMIHASADGPKVRKAAQTAILDILNHHAICKCDTLAAHIAAFTKEVLSQATSTNQTKTMQLLNFLKNALPVLPGDVISKLLDELLRLLSFENATLRLVVLQTIDELVSTESAVVKPKDVERILTKTLEVDVGLQHEAISGHMIRVQWYGMLRMQSSSDDNTNQTPIFLPRVILSLSSCFESQYVSVQKRGAYAMLQVLEQCLSDEIMNGKDKITSGSGGLSTIERIVCTLENLLSLRYQHSWEAVLPFLAKVFTLFGNKGATLLKKLLKTVADLNEALSSIPNASSNLEKMFEEVVASAIASLGPQVVLDVLPLKDDKTNLVPDGKVWLIPVLRESLKNCACELSVFSTYILTAARASEASSNREGISVLKAKQLRVRTMQLWSLFPSFCAHPTDIATGFKGIAKLLVNALSDQRYPELRLMVCQGLKNLCLNAATPEDRALLSKYAQRYLPILFGLVENLSSEKESESLQTLIECIEALAKITTREFISDSLFKQLVQKLLEMSTMSKQLKADGHQSERASAAAESSRLLMCIALALVPCLDDSSVKLLYRVANPYLLDDQDSVMQKRAYTILVSICEHHPSFIVDEENLNTLIDSLCESLLTCSVPARKMRLRCLVHLINTMSSTGQINTTYIPSLVGEIMLCTKESNAKAREVAFELLIAMGHLMKASDPQNGLSTYLQMILGGLAAQTPHMRSAAVLSLSRLVFEFGRQDALIADKMQDLLRLVLMLLHEKAREVIKSVIGFLKLAIAILPLSHLREFLPDMLTGLLLWVGDSKDRFKAKTRIILIKLIRKFGYDTIYELVPEKDRKLIIHIRKTTERENKKKEGGSYKTKSFDDFMDSDDEGDEEESSMQPEKTASKKPSTDARWIQENATRGDILDFLDQSAIKNIMSKNPKDKKDDDDHDMEFKFAEDGRIIIEDDDNNAAMTDRDEKHDDENMKLDIQNELKKMGLGEQKRSGTSNEATTTTSTTTTLDRKKKRKANHHETGSEYRSKKARGDMKKKGKVEPYAYISLDPKNMAKRNRRTAVSRFEQVGKNKKKSRR